VIALTESLSWVRALDDALNHIWRKLPEDARREITVRIDEALERPGWDPNFVAWARSTRSDRGYSDWTIGLIVRRAGIPRDELQAMRWLAGKMLHFGPLPAVELKQWRQGEEPRWKWRKSADIFPTTRGERGSDDRQAYDEHLAGRDLIGTFNLFDALYSAEFLVWELMGRPERNGE
jgi:hypothetical protein